MYDLQFTSAFNRKGCCLINQRGATRPSGRRPRQVCECMQLHSINHRPWSTRPKTGTTLLSGTMIERYYGDQIKDDEVGVACHTFCTDEKCIPTISPKT